MDYNELGKTIVHSLVCLLKTIRRRRITPHLNPKKYGKNIRPHNKILIADNTGKINAKISYRN
jgi:hypothetical protein